MLELSGRRLVDREEWDWKTVDMLMLRERPNSSLSFVSVQHVTIL